MLLTEQLGALSKLKLKSDATQPLIANRQTHEVSITTGILTEYDYDNRNVLTPHLKNYARITVMPICGRCLIDQLEGR
ncbi:MAG: hypothetical protein WKF73_14025 [Nocardioidaceae bacterium]